MDQHYTGVMIDPWSSCVCLSGYAYAILECYLHNGYHLVCDKIYLLKFALFSKFNESMLPAYFSPKWKNNMERNITGIYEITNFWCWYGFQPVRPQICLWFVFQPAGICLIQILVWFWFPSSWKLLSGLPTSTALLLLLLGRDISVSTEKLVLRYTITITFSFLYFQRFFTQVN